MPLLIWIETSGKLLETRGHFSMVSCVSKWIYLVGCALGKGKR